MKRSISALLFALTLPLHATELFPEGNAEQGEIKTLNGPTLETTARDAKEGQHAFILKEKQVLILDRAIPIDPQKTYELSATMRSVDGQKPASANFGIYMYTADHRQIGLRNVSNYPGTETTLLKPLEKGSRELWLKEAAAWKQPAKQYRAALHAKEDFSDLPNFHLSPRLETLEKTDDGWKATLMEPSEADYPAGTPVRQHSAWGPGLYWVANEWVPTEWKTYSTTLHGIAPSGNSLTQFWKGTAYVRIMVRYGNWDRIPEEGAELLIDNLSFREVPAAPAP